MSNRCIVWCVSRSSKSRRPKIVSSAWRNWFFVCLDSVPNMWNMKISLFCRSETFSQTFFLHIFSLFVRSFNLPRVAQQLERLMGSRWERKHFADVSSCRAVDSIGATLFTCFQCGAFDGSQIHARFAETDSRGLSWYAHEENLPTSGETQTRFLDWHRMSTGMVDVKHDFIASQYVLFYIQPGVHDLIKPIQEVVRLSIQDNISNHVHKSLITEICIHLSCIKPNQSEEVERELGIMLKPRQDIQKFSRVLFTAQSLVLVGIDELSCCRRLFWANLIKFNGPWLVYEWWNNAEVYRFVDLL